MVKKSHGFVMLAALGFSFILIFSTLLKDSGVPSLQQVLFGIGVSLAMLSFFCFPKSNFAFLEGKIYFSFQLSG